MITLSVLLLDLPPENNAISNNNSATPPTIHTHGCIYHKASSAGTVEVEDVFTTVLVVSCANTIKLKISSNEVIITRGKRIFFIKKVVLAISKQLLRHDLNVPV
jgi:hypothetical protein